MDKFLEAAIEEARKGMASGGVPIGSVLVIDGQIVGRGPTSESKMEVRYCTQKCIVWKMQDE